MVYLQLARVKKSIEFKIVAFTEVTICLLCKSVLYVDTSVLICKHQLSR